MCILKMSIKRVSEKERKKTSNLGEGEREKTNTNFSLCQLSESRVNIERVESMLYSQRS